MDGDEGKDMEVVGDGSVSVNVRSSDAPGDVVKGHGGQRRR